MAWFLLQQQEPASGESLADLPELRVEGAKVDPRLRVRSGRRGRGLFLEGDVQEGTVLLSVPPQAVLSPERAARLLLQGGGDVAVAQGDGAAEGALQWGLLPALLARVRAELEDGRLGSFGLGPYVQVLPGSFPSLPVSLTAEDVERELRGTALVPATLQLRARLLADRDAARHALEGTAGASSKDAIPSSMWSDTLWLWACSVLLTRGGLGLSLAGGEYGLDRPSLALVPLVDLANCDSQAPTCEVRAGSSGEVCLVALRALSSGAEATFDYGARSHEQTLFTFGYLPDSGEFAVTSPLYLGCEEQGGVRHALLRLLALDQEDQQLAGPAPAARLRRPAGGLGPVGASELIAAANLLEMSSAELKVAAGQVASSGRLPPELGLKPKPATRKRLLALLEAWSAELLAQQAPTEPEVGDEHLRPLRRYRAECAQLVGEALRALRA